MTKILDTSKPMQNHLGAKVVHAEPAMGTGYYVTCRYANGTFDGYHVGFTGRFKNDSRWPTAYDVFNVPEPPKKLYVVKQMVEGIPFYHVWSENAHAKHSGKGKKFEVLRIIEDRSSNA